jgi:hypothetical protein
MTKRTILIIDDEARVRWSWKEQLERIPLVKRYFNIEVLETGFPQALSVLESRRKQARTKKGRAAKSSSPETEKSIIDDAAILIVDYDLLGFDRDAYTTGEGVAYLARCYSRCDLIIALNQFGENRFDLSLKGNPESYADLNIGSEQLTNPGLWDGKNWTGFRPWSWPLLPQALDSFESRVTELLSRSKNSGKKEKLNLDEPILSYLGFPNEVIEYLPRQVREFLGHQGSIENITFREFVIDSSNGLRRKDEAIDDDSVARIAAARVSKWLERLVLPGQDILVDAPHLVSRYPSLLKGASEKDATWNKTALFAEPSKLSLKHEAIESFEFKKPSWLSRPAWFWQKVSNSENVAEVKAPWAATSSQKSIDYVFCEDISRFLPRDSVREFVADLSSPFIRRFVANPRSGRGRELADQLGQVNYVPTVRFSL